MVSPHRCLVTWCVLFCAACSAATGYEAPPPDDGCFYEVGGAVEVPLGEAFVYRGGPREETRGFALFGGEHIVAHATGSLGSNGVHDTEIVQVSLADGELVQLTANEHENYLLDARDGQVLTMAADMTLLDVARDTEVTLAMPHRRVWLGDGPLTTRPRRMLTSHGVTWSTPSGIAIYDGTTTFHEEVESPDFLGIPMWGDGAVYWIGLSEVQGTRALFQWRDGQLSELTPSAWMPNDLHTGSGHVTWAVYPSGLAVLARGTSEPVVVAEGQECGDPFILGDMVTFVCELGVYQYNITEQTLRHVYLSEESDVGGPRMNANGVTVWLVLEEPCGGSGQVLMEHRGSISTVASVQTDDYCVGHMPLPIHLEVTDGHVVWSDMHGLFSAPLRCAR